MHLPPEILNSSPPPKNRQEVLRPLISYIQEQIDGGQEVNLNFICTHNSRRSQLAQIWATTAAAYYGIPVNCFSGGTEATAFNERAVASLRRSGFRIRSEGTGNPVYTISFSDRHPPIKAFSKTFDDPANQADHFAAIMTCADADANCPFIPGADVRIPIRYEDPKRYDDTPLEAIKYDERSAQIARELFFVFSNIHLPA